MPDGRLVTRNGSLLVGGPLGGTGEVVVAPATTTFCPACGLPQNGCACQAVVTISGSGIINPGWTGSPGCYVVTEAQTGSPGETIILTGSTADGTFTLPFIGLGGSWAKVTDIVIGEILTTVPGTPCEGEPTGEQVYLGVAVVSLGAVDGVSCAAEVFITAVRQTSKDFDGDLAAYPYGGAGATLSAAVVYLPDENGTNVADDSLSDIGEVTLAFTCTGEPTCPPCSDCYDPEDPPDGDIDAPTEPYPAQIVIDVSGLGWCNDVSIGDCPFTLVVADLQAGYTSSHAVWIGNVVNPDGDPCLRVTVTWAGGDCELVVEDTRTVNPADVELWRGLLLPSTTIEGPAGLYSVLCDTGCGNNPYTCRIRVTAPLPCPSCVNDTPTNTAPDVYPDGISVDLTALKFCESPGAVLCPILGVEAMSLELGSSPTSAVYTRTLGSCILMRLVWNGTYWRLTVSDTRPGFERVLWDGYLTDGAEGPAGNYVVICDAAGCPDDQAVCTLTITAFSNDCCILTSEDGMQSVQFANDSTVNLFGWLHGAEDYWSATALPMISCGVWAGSGTAGDTDADGNPIDSHAQGITVSANVNDDGTVSYAVYNTGFPSSGLAPLGVTGGNCAGVDFDDASRSVTVGVHGNTGCGCSDTPPL